MPTLIIARSICDHCDRSVELNCTETKTPAVPVEWQMVALDGKAYLLCASCFDELRDWLIVKGRHDIAGKKALQ